MTLSIFVEEVANYLDSWYPVEVIYLDFQKAFDEVPHKRLILKLAAHGIDGKLLEWIDKRLLDRKQSNKRGVLRLEGCVERCPTGFCFGTIVICDYINDIDEFIASHILKFADDTKIYHVVNSSTGIENLHQIYITL